MLTTCNNQRFLRVIVLVLTGAIVGHNALAQTDSRGGKTLHWNADIVSKYGENESVKLLNFEGARYDGSLNSLPYYTERLIHPYPGTQVTVLLKNAQYEPFTTTAVVDLSKIGTEPQLIARPVTEKKQAQLGISLLPIRKNPATQSLERLVSFDYDIVAGAPMAPTNNQRIYASNSVLSSGNWFKIAVNNTGIHIINVAFLQQLGMNPASVNPSKIRLY